MLARLLQRWLQPDPSRSVPPPAGGSDFAACALPLLERALALRAEWLAIAADEDPEPLANLAAVHRWTLAQLAAELERLAPPPPLRARHAAAVGALLRAARAAQWTSAGYRFHHSGKVCDGRALSEEAFAAIAHFHDALAREVQPLARVGA